MTADERFEQGVALVKQHIPKFEIRYKNEHLSSKILGVLCWLFNRKYMTHYTTTRYPYVYFPNRKFVESNKSNAYKILMHEFVHLWDIKHQGIWHNILYGIPQVIALVLLGGFIASGFLGMEYWWVLLTIAIPMLYCAAPTPAYWRMKSELRGYSMNIAVNYWRYGSVSDYTIDWIVSVFTGSGYLFMWPFKKNMRKRIDKVVARLGEGKMPFDQRTLPYEKVYEMLTKKE